MGKQADDAGPRRWWAGSLDVEGLALGAGSAAAAALDQYTGGRGRFSTTPTLSAAAFDSSGHLRIAGRKLQGSPRCPGSGARRTAGSGWIHANYPHHGQRLLQALGARSPAQVDPALRAMASLEAEAAIQAAGGIAAAVRTRSAWLASPMGEAADSGPWISLTSSDGDTTGMGLAGMPGPEAVPAGPPPADADITRPLAGVRVLDLTRVIAGPVATRLLAALGADVLRIDPPRLPELSDQFVDTCFDKRSAEADLGLPENQGRLRDLLAGADVVVTGYRQGALDRFGLDARDLLEARPALAVVTLNSWGATGPWSGLRGFDSIVQAAAGIADLYGREADDGGWHPGALPVQALDHATGYGTAAAAVTLLACRRRTGLGGTARLSLARTAGELFSLPGTDEAAAGLAPPDYRTMDSSFGELRYVPPPLLLDGQPLEYRNPPPPYGSSALAWA